MRCPGCRDAPPSRTLCFQCYRAELDRQRALLAAGALDTASNERFQYQLPFEPIDAGRLAMLKVARRTVGRVEVERGRAQGVLVSFAERRRRAQIAARHALQQTVARATAKTRGSPPRPDAALLAALHAVELQLPESWWPFVMSR